jgi:hypothetical protein
MGSGGRERGQGLGGEMTQTVYARVNKWIQKRKKKKNKRIGEEKKNHMNYCAHLKVVLKWL